VHENSSYRDKVFFGTPHRAAYREDWANILSAIANACKAGTDFIPPDHFQQPFFYKLSENFYYIQGRCDIINVYQSLSEEAEEVSVVRHPFGLLPSS
jgi:hypothetical protein